MRKCHGTAAAMITIGIFLWTLPLGLVSAGEPTRPNVDYTFDSKKESKISELKGLPVREVFDTLRHMDFVINQDLLNKAVFVAFKNREHEAVAYTLRYMTEPRQIVEGEWVSQNDDFVVAKSIFRMFPDTAIDSLLDLYNGTDALTKSNIICVLGKMEGDQAIRDLLIDALDDKTFCEEEDPERVGMPLRICDEAYNQLVLRYSIKGVLRTIGNSLRIEARDSFIDELKSSL
jgi:hypothetical protein